MTDKFLNFKIKEVIQEEPQTLILEHPKGGNDILVLNVGKNVEERDMLLATEVDPITLTKVKRKRIPLTSAFKDDTWFIETDHIWLYEVSQVNEKEKQDLLAYLPC